MYDDVFHCNWNRDDATKHMDILPQLGRQYHYRPVPKHHDNTGNKMVISVAVGMVILRKWPKVAKWMTRVILTHFSF